MAQEDDPTPDLSRLPVLYSFRRCPYAMRARMAIVASGVSCALREIVLRDKPAEMLAASPKGTVPVLMDVDGRVLDQSLDIMLWALTQHDPEAWLAPTLGTLADMHELIARCDGDFKRQLDGYKYPQRQPDGDATRSRREGSEFLMTLEARLAESRCLHGPTLALSDIAIAPFVRQFAQVDAAWFDAQPWPHLKAWLAALLASPLFEKTMWKFEVWKSGEAGVGFPPREASSTSGKNT